MTREISNKEGVPLFTVTNKKIAANEQRNAFLSKMINRYYELGRNMYVVSKLVCHLEELHKLCLALGVPDDTMCILPKIKAAARPSTIMQSRVVLCTLQMCKEGVDDKEKTRSCSLLGQGSQHRLPVEFSVSKRVIPAQSFL